MSSPFSAVALAPRDAIFGLNAQFLADPRKDKVNLCVGVYLDENGKVPLLDCVRAVEERMAEHSSPRGYLPMDGLRTYDDNVRKLVFGADSEPVQSGRVATVQSLGGTGALKVGADFLHQIYPDAPVLISDPSWPNHRGVFAHAGFAVGTDRYSSADTHGMDFDGMLADLKAAAPGTIAVLHACCHNPTGHDLSAAQWKQVVAVVQERGLIAFLDMAYQGFGRGLAEDATAVRLFAASGLQFLVASSYSKNFSLYGERVGALSVVCADQAEAERVLSQLKITVRTNYSNPPTHGASIVAATLADATLRAGWEEELAHMRGRIQAMRDKLASGLRAAGVQRNTSFITEQVGMFSYSGLTKAQMERLRSDFGVYGLDSGRLCVAALNEHNLPTVCTAIAAVM